MRVHRHIFHDARHLASLLPDVATEDQYLPDRVLSLEIFPGDTFGNHHLVRPVQAGVPVPFQQLEVEEIEEVRLRIADAGLPVQQLVILHHLLGEVLAADTGVIFHGAQVLLHRRSISGGRSRPVVRQLPVLVETRLDTEDTLLPVVHIVVAILESHIGQDQQGGRHTDRQPRYIDGAESFLLRQAAPGTVPIV